MSILGELLDDLIEDKLHNLHTIILAKVIALNTDHSQATIKPLSKIQERGAAAEERAVIELVPVCRHVRGHIQLNDVAVCGCSERAIEDVVAGNTALPVAGRHRISDAIVLGVL